MPGTPLGTDDGGVAQRLAAIEQRLDALVAVADDTRRRQRLAELRRDPSWLLAGLTDVRRVVPERLDELTDVLSRWDVPLTDDELHDLRHAGLVAQGISGPAGSKVHLVVDVVAGATHDDLELAARRARIFSARNRRAIPVVLTLEQPVHEVAAAAADLGVVLLTDD